VVESLVRCVSLVVLIACMGESIPSRIMEMPITMMRGAQAVSGLMGEIMEIDIRIEMTRK
jgi:hypothetical protein